MRNIRISPQNNTEELVGLHFFTQCLDELLFDHSDDSYKAPALNLIGRVFELARFSSYVTKMGISQESLKPFIDELDWGLSIDPVLGPTEKSTFQSGLKRATHGGPNAKKLIPFLDWLKNDLDKTYFQRLNKSIKDTIINGHNKSRLRALAISFAVQIEIEGYGRRFAYQHVQRKLIGALRKKIPPDIENVISKFLEAFEGKKQKHKVFFRGSKTFINHVSQASDWGISISGTKPELSKQHKNLDDFFGENNNSYIIINEIECHDPYIARDIAENFLNTFVSVIKYYDHHAKLDFDEICIVETSTDSRTWYTTVGSKLNPVLCRSDQNKDFDNVGASRLAKLIAGHHLTKQSARKYSNALNYHRVALSAPIIQNQLVALWAALEGLLPNPEATEVRIKYFVEVVSSIISLVYIKKLLSTLADELNNENKDIADIINTIPSDTWLHKVTLFISSTDCAKERTDVAAKLDSNPLLRYRIKELNDSLQSAKVIHKTITNHKKKIEWHLSRIYWVRNLIVHSAESMPYMSTVIENLHDYLDFVMDSIASTVERKDSVSSIDSVIHELLTKYELRIEKLISSSRPNDTQCNNTNSFALIYGDDL